MSEEGAAESIATSNEAARAQLVNRLQRLWQSDPGSYWPEFRASGLEPKDVWPHLADNGGSREMLKSEMMTPAKRKGSKKEAEE